MSHQSAIDYTELKLTEQLTIKHEDQHAVTEEEKIIFFLMAVAIASLHFANNFCKLNQHALLLRARQFDMSRE